MTRPWLPRPLWLALLVTLALGAGACKRKRPTDGPLIIDCTTTVRRELSILISTGTPEAQLAQSAEARRRLILSWMARVSPPREYISRCMTSYGAKYRACVQAATENGGLIACHKLPDAPVNSALQPIATTPGTSDETP